MSQTFYVDSRSGSDANAGTSPDAAWASLDKLSGMAFAPGDTILFARGAAWSGTLHLNGSGADGAPITFAAYGDGAAPLITGGSNGVEGNGQSHIVIRDLEISGVNGPAIETHGSYDWLIDGIKFDHDGNGYNGAAVQWWDGDHLTISNSTLTNMTGDGLWIWNADGVHVLNNHIEVCQGDSADNLHMYAPRNYEIRGNYFSMEGNTSSGKGNIHSQAGDHGVIADNTLVGGNYGVGTTDSDLTIQNNQILDHVKQGWSAGILVSEVYDIANNTIVGNVIKDATNGIYSFQDYARDNFNIHDNVFDGIHRVALLNEGSLSGAFSNNTVVAPSGTNPVEFDGWVPGGQSWGEWGNVVTDIAPAMPAVGADSASSTPAPAPVSEAVLMPLPSVDSIIGGGVYDGDWKA